MKYITSSKSMGSKVTGIASILFLSFGIFMICLDPSVPFFWAWTLFMLIAFSLWLFSYIKGHKWKFEVTTDFISFESPFMPKLRESFWIRDIAKITFSDGETTSGKIFLNDGKIINIPGPCLPRLVEIANSIEEVGVEVYLNNKNIS